MIVGPASDCVRVRLKCDRAQPCKNCERRPLGSCVYVHSGGSKKIDRAASAAAQNRNISVQDRIRRLERLVVSLAETPSIPTVINGQGVSQQAKANANEESFKSDSGGLGQSTQDVAGPFGRLSVDDSETRFVNPTNWEAILDDVGSTCYFMIRRGAT